MGYAIGFALENTIAEDYEDLIELAQGGADIRMYIPSEDLGGMLDASRSAIQRRYALGEKAALAPRQLPRGPRP